MMRVSVIIPTYNRSILVRDAVASVLAQTHIPAEVIVVDDGSTDHTAEDLRQCFGERVCCISQSRAGVSAARNAGIRNASCEWLAFLDSDDLWLPRKLEAQLAYIARNPHLKIVQTEEKWVRKGKHLNPKKYHCKPEGHCFDALLERCLISPSAVMIRRELFEEVGLFDETLPACEDYDLWLRIGCRYPIGLVREPLIIKRGGHPDQLSTTVPALDRYRILAIAKLLDSGVLNGSQRKAAIVALRRKCHIYAEGCVKREKFQEAEETETLYRRLS